MKRKTETPKEDAKKAKKDDSSSGRPEILSSFHKKKTKLRSIQIPAAVTPAVIQTLTAAAVQMMMRMGVMRKRKRRRRRKRRSDILSTCVACPLAFKLWHERI